MEIKIFDLDGNKRGFGMNFTDGKVRTIRRPGTLVLHFLKDVYL